MVIYDFSNDPLSDLRNKEVKRNALNALIDYMAMAQQPFSANVHRLSVEMVRFYLHFKNFDRK